MKNIVLAVSFIFGFPLMLNGSLASAAPCVVEVKSVFPMAVGARDWTKEALLENGFQVSSGEVKPDYYLLMDETAFVYTPLFSSDLYREFEKYILFLKDHDGKRIRRIKAYRSASHSGGLTEEKWKSKVKKIMSRENPNGC